MSLSDNASRVERTSGTIYTPKNHFGAVGRTISHVIRKQSTGHCGRSRGYFWAPDCIQHYDDSQSERRSCVSLGTSCIRAFVTMKASELASTRVPSKLRGFESHQEEALPRPITFMLRCFHAQGPVLLTDQPGYTPHVRPCKKMKVRAWPLPLHTRYAMIWHSTVALTKTVFSNSKDFLITDALCSSS